MRSSKEIKRSSNKYDHGCLTHYDFIKKRYDEFELLLSESYDEDGEIDDMSYYSLLQDFIDCCVFNELPLSWRDLEDGYGIEDLPRGSN